MAYAPFARGPFPVGVVSVELGDRRHRRAVELWYPATDAHRGHDLDARLADRFDGEPGRQRAVRDATPRIGSFPLVVHSHGQLDHRRGSTSLCTHLASHGYVVAAPDHGRLDAPAPSPEPTPGRRPSPARAAAAFGAALDGRLRDVAVVIDGLVAGQRAPWARGIDRARIALVGHGLGGWTALATAARDPRIAAVLALAPAGGGTLSRGAELLARVDWSWPRVTPTLLVAGSADVVAPLEAVRELHAALRAPRRLLVLVGAGHHHFVDDGERRHEALRARPDPGLALAAPLVAARGLLPFARAEEAVLGLGVLELDAFLKNRDEALRGRAGALAGELAARGVSVELG